MLVSLRALKNKFSEVYLGPCQTHVMKFLFAEVVNVFQSFTIFVKKLCYSCSAYPKYASEIFVTVFTAVLRDYLK